MGGPMAAPVIRQLLACTQPEPGQAARREILANTPIRARIFEQEKVNEQEQVVLPIEIAIQPGERLLAVRGSGLALEFLQHGPIYEEARQHPEIETFVVA
jgi:hypothetical protein